MGSEPDSTKEVNTEKATHNKIIKNLKIGACEMQGWRSTMEDAAIFLPYYEKNASLFGVLDGHGGSIVSEFVSVNFKNVLVRTKSYKKGKYEKSLIETFLLMDELLKNKKINNFIYSVHCQKEGEKLEEKKNYFKKDSIVKLRFEDGSFVFDLDEIDLGDETDSIEAIILEDKDKNKRIKEKSSEINITIDDAKTRVDSESNKDDELSSKNLQLEDIFFHQSGKQNSQLNGLPSLEEVFNFKKCKLKFDKKPSSKVIENNSNSNNNSHENSSKSLKYERSFAYDMGTTANIMLIKNNVIYLANVGDSLSVMYKDKKAYNLNREHQTIIASEKERILNSGANIQGYRINGRLNLTRAIGDLRFKSNKNLKRHEQSVIALPDITKIEDIDNIEFIIMACDGVWDCVKRQLVCEFIEKEIKDNPEADLSDILQKIFDRCISPVWGVVLGTDNMTCIIIQFLHNKSENIEDKIKIRKVNLNIKMNNEEEISEKTTNL